MPSFPSKAMLLAAGLGERLRPLTLTTPKPLIPVEDRPLMTYNIALLRKAGIKELMINLHHLGEQIQSTLGDGKNWGMKFHYSFENEILGTGGGIKKVESFFGEDPFIVMNGDILIDVDLQKVWEAHQKSNSIGTLVLSPAERKDVKRLVYLDSQNQILSISEKAPEKNSKGYVFTGVQILESKVLKQLPPHGKSCIVEDAYVPLLAKGGKLSGFVCENYFRDLGTYERYEEVKKEFSKNWPYTTLSPADFASA